MGAASEGLILESEGENAGLVQGGDTHFGIRIRSYLYRNTPIANTLGLAVLLDTGNVGPEPTIHLRPGHVLVAVLLRVSEVKNVLQETVSLLQIRNTHVAKKV